MGWLDNRLLIFFIISRVIGKQSLAGYVIAWVLFIPLRISWSRGVSCWEQCECSPADTWVLYIADRYTLTVAYVILSEARWVPKRIRMALEVGIQCK